MSKPANKTPTARELVAAKKAAAAPAKPAATAIADPRPYRDRYLDEVAPSGIVGRMIKFSKEGAFVTHDDGKPVPESAEFVALCDQTLIGWVKFNGEGEPPDRVMGLFYDGFVMPPVESLPDRDKSQWDLGLDNEPQDPWQHHQYLVLQETKTLELFTFVTSSKTGRRAVGNLLRHYNSTRRLHPDELPVVRLRKGGYEHKNSRVGWVTTPVFVVCGRQSRDSVATPDTSLAANLDDDIPDFDKE